MFQAAIPVLHVNSSIAAEEFYCGRLGFQKEFAYRFDEAKPDPCYMGLRRDNAWIHLSSFAEDGVAGGVVYIRVDDVDNLFREFVNKDIVIDLPPTDQTWGNREMYVKDADGNSLRFISETLG